MGMGIPGGSVDGIDNNEKGGRMAYCMCVVMSCFCIAICSDR